MQAYFLIFHFSEHDDLLNFEIGDDNFADETINEDELLGLSDDGESHYICQHLHDSNGHDLILENFEDTKPKIIDTKSPTPQPVQEPEPLVEEKQEEPVPEVEEKVPEIQKPVSEVDAVKSQPENEPAPYPIEHQPPPQLSQPPQPPQQFPRQFRPQKFQPRGMPRWMGPGQFPNQRQGPPNRGMMMQNSQRPPMRPGSGPFPPQRAPFFMPQRPGAPPPLRPQRFFFQNSPAPVPAPVLPAYVPTPIGQVPPTLPGVQQSMPRKVLINPNFKGGVEAAKSKLQI